jgi:thymidylate synthase
MFDFNGKRVEADNIDIAWNYWYEKITEDAGTAESRDGAVVGEILNAVTVIKDPTRCILKSPIRKLPMRYMIGELLWYLSGNPKLEAIQLYTHAWDRMSDDGERVNSNYGARIQNAVCEESGERFNQLEMVEHLLTIDPASRQAVIHIKQPRDLVLHPSKDVNCTVCLQFFIRDGKLYLTTYMRSNDLWMGFPNDVFQFTCIQIYLAMRLGVQLGTYTHIAGSLHLYQRDYEKSLENRGGAE